MHTPRVGQIYWSTNLKVLLVAFSNAVREMLEHWRKSIPNCLQGQKPFTSAQRRGKFDAFGLKCLSWLRRVIRHKIKQEESEGSKTCGRAHRRAVPAACSASPSSLWSMEKHRFLKRTLEIEKLLLACISAERLEPFWFVPASFACGLQKTWGRCVASCLMFTWSKRASAAKCFFFTMPCFEKFEKALCWEAVLSYFLLAFLI